MGTREHPLHGNATPENNRMDKNAQSFSSCAGISPTSRVCIECRVGYYKLGDKCLATCPIQYYGHVEIVLSRESHTNRTAASCRKCHAACYKCKGPRSIDCFECSSGYILKGRQCIPKQLLDFMGHSEFLIWAVLLAFLLLIVMYTLYRLRHRCLCLQEKQQQNNPTIREMSLHPSAPSAPQPAWSPSRPPQQPTLPAPPPPQQTPQQQQQQPPQQQQTPQQQQPLQQQQPPQQQQPLQQQQPPQQQQNLPNQHHRTHTHHYHRHTHRHHHHHHHHTQQQQHQQQPRPRSTIVAAEQIF